MAAILAVGSMPASRAAIGLAFEAKPRALAMPVRGAKRDSLVDSWQEGPGVREHRAIDVFCVRGTDVLAPTRGIVVSVGAHVVKLLGPGAQIHLFDHVVPLAGLQPGREVETGEVLGQVGEPTGEERGSTPHLHYAVTAFPGRAFDPYPLLIASQASP